MKRLAIVSFAVGAVLAAFFIIMIIRTVPSTPQPVGGGLVHLSDDGMKIYASQPDTQSTCEVKTTGDADVPLEQPSGSESIGINGVNWYLVAETAEVVPAGDYLVSCVDSEPGTRFAVAPKSSIVLFVVSILGLVFSVLIFVILGVVLLTVGSRRKRKGGGNTFPGGYPQQPGGPGGYPQQPGYPPPGGPQYGQGQQGNTFPGYPPPGNYNPGPNPDRPQDT